MLNMYFCECLLPLMKCECNVLVCSFSVSPVDCIQRWTESLWHIDLRIHLLEAQRLVSPSAPIFGFIWREIRPKVCFSVSFCINNQSFFYFLFLAFLQPFLEAPAGQKIFFLISFFYFLFIFFWHSCKHFIWLTSIHLYSTTGLLWWTFPMNGNSYTWCQI